MSHQVVIAVASKYGHTREIAERIAAVLSEAGLDAGVQDTQDMHDIAGAEAVVLGSAVTMGRWRYGAVDFLRIHEQGLLGLPLWVFSSGPVAEGDSTAPVLDGPMPAAVADIVGRVGVVGSIHFPGALYSKQLSLAERLVMRALSAKEGDFRDWDAIEAWARGIAAHLRPEGEE